MEVNGPREMVYIATEWQVWVTITNSLPPEWVSWCSSYAKYRLLHSPQSWDWQWERDVTSDSMLLSAAGLADPDLGWGDSSLALHFWQLAMHYGLVWLVGISIDFQSHLLSPIGRQKPGAVLKYFRMTRSISRLLMPWRLVSPGHQQPWYLLPRITACF